MVCWAAVTPGDRIIKLREGIIPAFNHARALLRVRAVEIKSPPYTIIFECDIHPTLR